MLNFTVGPVMSPEAVRVIGAEQVPYFRTPEFSAVMKENELLVKQFSKAEEAARVVFLTGSGTASMEAAVMNSFTDKDKLLVVNGGSFGQRFVQLCQIHHIPYTEINPTFGHNITEEMLAPYDHQGYTGFLINVHETSTGVLYDMNIVSRFCRRNHLFLVVDAISSFLADPFDMKALGVDVMIAGSQKALACPPGISLTVFSPQAVARIETHQVRSMYFDLKSALKNGERGQTPFTPAVSILLQINERLRQIASTGGVDAEVARVKAIADDFRSKIAALPFEITSHSLSNCVTPLHPLHASAYEIFIRLKDEYKIWICPNGGELADTVFRVGHIGDLTTTDNDRLIAALTDLSQKGLL